VQRGEYELTVLRELGRILLNPNKQTRRREDGGLGEKVRLDTSSQSTRWSSSFGTWIAPSALFGFDMEAIEWHEPRYDLRFLDPEVWTTIVWGNFQERIVSQPLLEECMEGYSPSELIRL
jgi:hypothetical protein